MVPVNGRLCEVRYWADGVCLDRMRVDRMFVCVWWIPCCRQWNPWDFFISYSYKSSEAHWGHYFTNIHEQTCICTASPWLPRWKTLGSTQRYVSLLWLTDVGCFSALAKCLFFRCRAKIGLASRSQLGTAMILSYIYIEKRMISTLQLVIWAFTNGVNIRCFATPTPLFDWNLVIQLWLNQIGIINSHLPLFGGS